jgi:hypothetical protein
MREWRWITGLGWSLEGEGKGWRKVFRSGGCE